MKNIFFGTIVSLALLSSLENTAYGAPSDFEVCNDVNKARSAIQERFAHRTYAKLFLGIAQEDPANRSIHFSFFIQTGEKFGDIGEIIVDDTCVVTVNSTTAYDITRLLQK